MSLIKELWNLMKVRKKFWLAPIMIVLVILSGLIGVVASSPILNTLYMLF